jgi:hypothetical protein
MFTVLFCDSYGVESFVKRAQACSAVWPESLCFFIACKNFLSAFVCHKRAHYINGARDSGDTTDFLNGLHRCFLVNLQDGAVGQRFLQ